MRMRQSSSTLILFFYYLIAFFQRVNGEPTHECLRDCNNGTARVCTYTFHVALSMTMSKACYNCPLNYTDCSRPECMAADGVKRPTILVNGQFPGPSIQVCEGDQVIVDVNNCLPGLSTSIHWHGIPMENNPYMDGVPMVTQCPIPPGNVFRYNFTATKPGTHYYHSNSGLQRADGLFGPLVVRQARQKDPQSSLYDLDLPDHVMLISDWTRELGMVKLMSSLFDGQDEIPANILINGRGRNSRPVKEHSSIDIVPLTTFTVEKGRRYRFRIINNGILNCPVQVSIDSHALLVIASDGNPVEPFEVDSLILTSGERYDVVVKADKEISAYWVRVVGLMEWNNRNLFQAAVLSYKGTIPDLEPLQIITYSNSIRLGRILNPVNVAPGDQQRTTVAELKALPSNKTADWTGEPQKKFYLGFDFNPAAKLRFTNQSIFGTEQRQRLMIPQMNRISMRMPPVPLLSTQNVNLSDVFCNDSTATNCSTQFCYCTHMLQIPLGSLVELVLIDEGVPFDNFQPFHLHGFSFRVVAMQRVGKNVTVDQIKAMDRNGQIKRNLVNAPVKDTVPVPDGGYTVIRFVANNPGFWILHSNLAFNAEMGLSVVLKVGEYSNFPPVPTSFPTCSSWYGNEVARQGVSAVRNMFSSIPSMFNFTSGQKGQPEGFNFTSFFKFG